MWRLASSKKVQWSAEGATTSGAQNHLNSSGLRFGIFDEPTFKKLKKMRLTKKIFWKKYEGVILHDGNIEGRKTEHPCRTF